MRANRLRLRLRSSRPLLLLVPSGPFCLSAIKFSRTPGMSETPPKIVVLGSLNVDLVARCARLPVAGETLTAAEFQDVFGGKGANQAVGAARAGGNVSMIGRVGDDVYADRLLQNLAKEAIATDSVLKTSGTSSGLAMITVDDCGENQIVVVPGANGHLGVHDVDRFADTITGADVLLLQLEVPAETVGAAVAVARSAGVRVILDPAPAPTGAIPEFFFNVDLLCPNQAEISVICGRSCHSVDEISKAAASLRKRGIANVVVTLGEQGALLCDDQGCRLVGSSRVDVVDTTGAGDAFAAALAVHWAQHDRLEDAVRFANAAGALAASQMGAQRGMADCLQIEALCADTL